MPIPMQSTQILIEKIQSLPMDRIAEVEDFVEFLKQRTISQQTVKSLSLDFPVDNLGTWPNELSLSREDMSPN